jgi:hypothetical protein
MTESGYDALIERVSHALAIRGGCGRQGVLRTSRFERYVRRIRGFQDA